MSKPVSEWDEDYILSLSKENDEFDRKSARSLDVKAGADENDVLNELAKQLSAFANTGGGQIIYGVEDDGTIGLGGVSVDMKPGGTKEWLERKIPGLTEYELAGFGVHEFEPKSSGSQIASGKALYVVDVPDSEGAPHQSVRDKKYYIRNGSQSVPARHKLIEDIRNRLKHPRVVLAGVTTENVKVNQPTGDPQSFSLDIILLIALFNYGPLKSSDTFVSLNPGAGSFRFGYDKEAATGITAAKRNTGMWQINRTIPPQSEASFRASYQLPARRFLSMFPQMWREAGEQKPLDDVFIEWAIYADSAAPRTGRMSMRDIGLMDKLTLEHFN
jgi:schlafen family protein